MQFIYVVGSLVHTLAAESIRQKEISERTFAPIYKGLKGGFTNNLPKITVHGIMVNGKFAPTGTIVARTLAKEFFTDLIGEYHYGVVLGTDANGVEYIIEMTDIRNVNILTKPEFIEPHNASHFKIYSYPDKTFTPQTIYDKAKKYEYTSYSLLNFNCIDFSMSIVFDVEPKRRADELNQITLRFGDIVNKINDMNLLTEKDPVMREFYEDNKRKINSQKKIIEGSIQKKEKV